MVCKWGWYGIQQRYIQLQQAAALKPSSAAADSEADEDAQSSQGDPVLRGSRDAEYIGAVGQKQRRELMAELSEKVQATAHLLVPPLLDDGALSISLERHRVPSFFACERWNL